MEKKLKAITKERIQKDERYDFEKGAEFKVLNQKSTLTLIEDWLSFQYWIKNELLDIVEITSADSPWLTR